MIKGHLSGPKTRQPSNSNRCKQCIEVDFKTSSNE